MRTPTPFEPPWKAVFGPFSDSGKGLVPNQIKAVADFLEVILPSVTVRVSPKLGKISLNGTLVVSGNPGVLVWYRRMEQELATVDTNILGRARLLFYCAGISGEQKMVRIFGDGKVTICAD